MYCYNCIDDCNSTNWKTNMTFELEEYYKFLVKDKRCSDNTLESYQRDLIQFQNYIIDKNISYLKCDENFILEYLEELRKNGKSDATRARILASIKGFYIYLIKNKKINQNSIETMQTVKVEKKKTTEDELRIQENKIKYILNMKFEDSPKGIRDKAILEMTYNTDIKATQLVSLKLSDYDSENQTIKIDDKILKLDNSINDALSKYLKYSREILVMKDVQELFVNAQGRKMTRQGYWKIIKSYEDKYDVNSENFRQSANLNNSIQKEETLEKKISTDVISNFILKCMNYGKKED